MKGTVISMFADKYNGHLYNAGDTFECDDKERIADMVDRGLLKVADEKAETKSETSATPKKARSKK